jgi:hypothetical protein
MAENLWSSIIASDYVLDYILDDVAEVLYEKFLDTKKIPFTVETTMGIIDNLLELTYIRYDPGEEHDWNEPLEPPPVTNDTWARGVIPVVKRQRPVIESKAEIALIDDSESIGRISG